MNAQVQTKALWETLDICVYRDAQEIRDPWIRLSELANDPYSCYAWCQAWYEASQTHRSGEPLIVVGRRGDGEIEMLLPLFVEHKAGLRLVTRPARRVSGDFGGIFGPKLRQSVNPDNARAFWKRVAKCIPGDVLAINGVSSDEIERGNPLGYLDMHQSRIDGFHTHLEDDWQAQYEAMFSSKIRRNDRRCARRMQEEGEVEYLVMEGPNAQGQALASLIAQKVEQLEKAGLEHHYHDPTVKSFYENLAPLMDQSQGEEFLFVALKYNEEVIATNFGVRKGDRHYGMMTAMSEHMRKFSPGRLVMLETAKLLTERGCSFYDFGNGEYQYKQYWCSGKRSRYTVLAPLSWKGQILVPGIKYALRRKDAIADKEAQQAAQGKTPAPPVNKSES